MTLLIWPGEKVIPSCNNCPDKHVARSPALVHPLDHSNLISTGNQIDQQLDANPIGTFRYR